MFPTLTSPAGAARTAPGMAPDRPFISVIVPVRNEEPFIRRTLDRLLGQDYDRARFEILVADGRSTDRTAALVALTGVAGGLAMLTVDRNRDYWSEERIWRDTVDKRPDNPRARLNYGVLLGGERRYSEAEAQLRESLRLKEPIAKAHLNLGSILCAQQRLEEGVPHLERAIALAPELAAAHRNLGEAYGALGRRAQAAAQFTLAVEGEPENVFLLNRLGWLLATSPEDEVRNAARATRCRWTRWRPPTPRPADSIKPRLQRAKRSRRQPDGGRSTVRWPTVFRSTPTGVRSVSRGEAPGDRPPEARRLNLQRSTTWNMASRRTGLFTSNLERTSTARM